MEEKAKELEETLEPLLQNNVYFEYTTPEGARMREHHVDMHKAFCAFVSDNNKQFGGNLSIRLPAGVRPILMIGQDESTFHQYVFSKQQWKGPNGKAFLMPKQCFTCYV
jgi:hypothetical protein